MGPIRLPQKREIRNMTLWAAESMGMHDVKDPIEQCARLRDGDRNPCGALLQLQDVRGQECLFRCYKSPWHRKHHAAFLGAGKTLRWVGEGREAGTRFPDSIDFSPRR